MNAEQGVVGGSTARVHRRRRIPLVWLVPIVSAAVALWLAWDTWSKRGPTITVSFNSGEGLQVGQSHLKFKDVDMGSVTAITVAPDHSKVLVTLETRREATSMFSAKTVFWVVKPELFAGRISGLDTLLSGSYIQMLPPIEDGPAQHNFVGLEDPPVLQTVEPGRTFHLVADQIGSVSIGSPILFRNMSVGTVLGWKLNDTADKVTIEAFVRAPFDRFVHERTHFWDASGLSVKFSGGALKVELASTKALLLGGVAFDLPADDVNSPASAADAVFILYASHDDAVTAGYGHQLHMVSTFTGPVSGLSIGSDVTLHGLKIGEVTDVGLVYNPRMDRVTTPVHYTIQPERIAGVAQARGWVPGTMAASMVERGLRATLQSSNLITGAQAVALEFFPDAPKEYLSKDGDVYVVPARDSGGFDAITRSAGELLAKINRMGFDKISDKLVAILSGVDSLVNGPPLQHALTSMDGMMSDARDMVHRTDAGVAPALRRLPEIAAQLEQTLAQANHMVGSLNDGYGNNSSFNRDLDHLLSQLTDAVRSIRALGELLERHPEALVRGRGN